MQISNRPQNLGFGHLVSVPKGNKYKQGESAVRGIVNRASKKSQPAAVMTVGPDAYVVGVRGFADLVAILAKYSDSPFAGKLHNALKEHATAVVKHD